MNTIESGKLKGVATDDQVSEFYLSLDKIFNLQYGKVLLATATKEELQYMVARSWPQITTYRNQVDSCLNGSGCQGIRSLVNTLGKTIKK